MVIGVLVVVVGSPLLFVGTMYGIAWYRRIQAQRLLTRIQTMRVGVTTETDFRAALRPIEDHVLYAHLGRAGDIVEKDEYDVYNSPSWPEVVLERMPVPIARLTDKLTVDGAMFSVAGSFQGGVLTVLRVTEMSCPPECGHPFSTDVRMSVRTDSEQVTLLSRDKPFVGYRFDTDMLDQMWDRPLPRPVLFHQRVFLDDRGTDEERRRALDFHLQCLTNWFGCRDAGQMLQPAPNP